MHNIYIYIYYVIYYISLIISANSPQFKGSKFKTRRPSLFHPFPFFKRIPILTDLHPQVDPQQYLSFVDPTPWTTRCDLWSWAARGQLSLPWRRTKMFLHVFYPFIAPGHTWPQNPRVHSFIWNKYHCKHIIWISRSKSKKMVHYVQKL